MSARYKRLLCGVAASLSLILAGCGSDWPGTVRTVPVAAPAQAATTPKPAPQSAGGIDTEATLWTVLGLAKPQSEQAARPPTRHAVNPVPLQATHDQLPLARLPAE